MSGDLRCECSCLTDPGTPSSPSPVAWAHRHEDSEVWRSFTMATQGHDGKREETVAKDAPAPPEPHHRETGISVKPGSTLPRTVA